MNTSATTFSSSRPTPLTRIWSRRVLVNYASTLAIVGLAFWFVTDISNFHRAMLQGQWQFGMFGWGTTITVHQVFISLIAIYAVVLIPYYASYPWMRSKTFIFFRGLWFAFQRSVQARRTRAVDPMTLPIHARLSPTAKQAGLALLLKFFFAPLMINWCLIHIANLLNALVQLAQGVGNDLSARALFDTSLFWAAYQFILFVDTLLFTLGYIVEIPALRNRIRTVDPTFFGWFVCLACYPPFNETTMRFLEWQSADFPFFENNIVHFAVNITLLLSLAIYSWASIALGFKASNLTNRGIVTRGPYKFVRHPAYAAKNFAWWLGALPAALMFYSAGNWRGFAYCLVAVFGWTAIYALRAITEERHLLMTDNGYKQYSERVRWRFVPGLW